MPKKITVDASGNVIAVEDVPEREVPAPQPKPGTGKKTKHSGRRETDAPYGPARRKGAASSIEMMVCSMCKASIPKGRMARHLREAHLRETIQQREQQIRGIDRDLQNMVPGFHRLEIEELRRKRALLHKDLEDLQRTAQERLGTKGTKP